MEIKPIAYIKNGYKEKFGIPRQSLLVNDVTSLIVINKEYSDINAFKGLDDFSHIWLIWEFSQCDYKEFTPMVRPPKLGGNTKMGVFSTRSPFRPNGLGLSCVKLEKITKNTSGNIELLVTGADLLDGTPIYDIKPYVSYSDSVINAANGFLENANNLELEVKVSQKIKNIPEHTIEEVKSILKKDPRPGYQNDTRQYGMNYDKYNIIFTVKNNVATIIEVLENVNGQ